MMNNADKINWYDYKKELWFFTGALIFSLAVLLTSWVDFQNADKKKLVVSQQYEQLKADVSDVIEGELLLKEVGASFEHLKSQGFYGDEDRLALTERLKKAADKLMLPSFKYAISPQQRIENVGYGFSKKLTLLESIVSFEGDLLHEVDFVHIVNELESFAAGSFIVQFCQLAREPSLTTFEITKNVGISCKLSFYTVIASEEESEIEDIGDGI
jgi:hypothetical protein